MFLSVRTYDGKYRFWESSWIWNSWGYLPSLPSFSSSSALEGFDGETIGGKEERKNQQHPPFPHISNIRENIWQTWNRLFLSLLTFSSRPFGIFLDIPPVFPHKHPFLKCHNHLDHVLLTSRNNLQHLLSLSQTHTPSRSMHDNKQAPPTRDLTNEFFSIFVAFCAIAQKATRTDSVFMQGSFRQISLFKSRLISFSLFMGRAYAIITRTFIFLKKAYAGNPPSLAAGGKYLYTTTQWGGGRMGGKTKLGGLLSQKGPCNFPNLPPFLLGGNMGKWRSVACQKILCALPPRWRFSRVR